MTSATLLIFGRRPPDETRAILTAYADTLLPVKAPAAAHHGETVDVQSFAALARTAQRHGLVIMTWSADGGQTFVVQDQTVRYRYTTTPPAGRSRRDRHRRTHSTAPMPAALASVHNYADQAPDPDADRDAG